MRASFIGMGKLGFPCALAAATKHEIVGYDASPVAKEILTERWYPHREEGAQELLESTTLKVVDTVDEAVAHGDIIFIAVQTPHLPEYEGITRMPETRADFDYTALKSAVNAVATSAKKQEKTVVIVVISTALPGTCKREVYPLLNAYTGFVYNPFFIAMGTTIADYMKPEMVLIGFDPEVGGNAYSALERLQTFYREIHEAPHEVMSVTSAELAKVAYNVFLGLKIVAANSVMEIAHKVGANCDDITRALAKATDRVVSSKYMKGGGGDSGNCHPRDQIALSWLAQKLSLSYDLFGSMVKAREEQTEWLAELCIAAATNSLIVILGTAYKRGTNLTGGSYTILLKNILIEKVDERARAGYVTVDQWDPHVDQPRDFTSPAVFLIGTNHDEFYNPNFHFPVGSTIIDPWGKMPDIEGCKVVRVGRH